MTKKDWQIVIYSSAAMLAVVVFVLVMRNRMRRKLNCQSDYFFIGDSTTADHNSYADQLRKICGAKVVKIAQSGAKTDWMLGVMNDHFSTPQKYDVISILAGSNDIFARLSIDKAKANMAQMIALASNHTDNIVLVAPPSKAFYPKTTNKHRELIYQWEQYLKSFEGKKGGVRIRYIPLPEIVNQQQYFKSDMQHMNSDGHAVLLGAFTDTLKIKNA